jgi:hypothetical protein
MKRIIIALSTAFLLALFFSVNPASATQIAPSTTPKGLSISPIRTEFDITPGTSYSGDLRISNNTANALVVSLDAEQFNVINSQYDYSFDPTSNLVHWVTFAPSKLTLVPTSYETVHYTIAAPLNAEPHGEYISLFASAQTPSDPLTNERVASLLYVTVNGAVTRTGEVISINNPWLTTGSVKWAAQIRNKGTVHFRSLYSTTIHTVFGGQVNSPTNSNTLILPGTIRDVAGSSSMPQLPGIYKITYAFGLGDTPAASVTHYFLYTPLIPSFCILACLLILGGFIPMQRMRLKQKEG